MAPRFAKVRHFLAVLLAPPITVALISLLRFQLADFFGTKAPYGLYIFGIILVAQFAGLTAGLITTFLSAIVGAVLFLPGPTIAMALTESEVIRVSLFVAEGLAISLSAEFLRLARVRAKRGELDLRLITDHVPAVIAYVDKAETYQFANQGFYDLFDVKPAAVLGKSSREFLTDAGYERVHDYIARALNGERVEYESELLLKNKKPVRIRGSYIPDLGDRGEVRGYFALVVDITEAYETAKAARVAQAEFQQVLKHSAVVYFALDKQGIFIRLEGEGLKVLNLDPQEMIGHSYIDVYKDAPHVAANMARALAGESFTTELAFQERSFAVQYSPTLDEQGQVTGLFGISTDITELKQAEAERLRISERLQLATESSQLGTWELDLTSNTLNWDARTRKLFGVSPTATITRELFFKLIHPDDLTPTKTHMEEALKPEHGRVSAEYRVIHPITKEVRWIFSQGKVEFDTDKKPLSVIGMLLDVSQLRHAEAALRVSQERLTLALESARMGTWHWEIETGRVSTASRFEGVSLDAPDMDFFEALDRYVHPEDLERVKDTLARSLAGDGRLTTEFRVRRPDGTVMWALCRGLAQIDANGRPLSVTGLLLDTTEQKKNEQELQRAKEEAERASTMKSAFLANMSHEIRTPLGAMLGFAGFLKDRALNEGERDHYVDVLTRNGEQLLHLIDDILDFSKVAAGHVTYEILPTRPARVVEDVISLLSVKAREKGLSITHRFEDSMPDLIGTDPTRLKQILFNIVGNAVKFTSQGTISIRVWGSESGLGGAEQISFEVRDTGIGIPPDRAEQLFQVFTQADESMTRKYGGTGLGLALSRRLAQGLGGDVRLLSSQPGTGSVFAITLQDQAVANTTTAPSRAPQSPVVAESERPLTGLRILLVEDSEDNRFLISRMITKRGGDLQIARNGAEGVSRASNETYDLVLMDIQMPVLDGYAATQQLRERGYRVPIIALTAHAMDDARTRTRDVGCNDYLTKPVQVNELVAMILRHAKSPAPAAEPEAQTST